MQVLVTGATGFVGANLTRRLLGDNHDVHVLTRPESDYWRLDAIRKDIQIHHESLEDKAALSGCLRQIKPQRVFHLAAYGAYSWQEDLKRIVLTNVLAAGNLLKCLADIGCCESFVAAGSSSEYGYKDHAPKEDEALEPNSEYSITKAAATHLCQFYAHKYELPTTVLRLYSAYGPYEDPKRFIPTIIEHGLRGKLPPLVNPNVARDFIFVDDAVSAFIAAAGVPGKGEIYNVGTGIQTTIADVVSNVRELFSIKDEPKWGSMPNRKWDTSNWVANTDKIRQALVWSPACMFKDGLMQTADWYRERLAVPH